jgi:hypothetical protein
MLPPSIELLLESVAEALQTMAFISPEPATGDMPAPADVVRLVIRWSGSHAGEVQLAAPRLLGELLAANILAVEPGTPEAAQRALDVLQELCNITAGGLLSRMSDSPQDAPEMSLPEAATLPDAAAWEQFIAQPQTTVLLVEATPWLFVFRSFICDRHCRNFALTAPR